MDLIMVIGMSIQCDVSHRNGLLLFDVLLVLPKKDTLRNLVINVLGREDSRLGNV